VHHRPPGARPGHDHDPEPAALNADELERAQHVASQRTHPPAVAVDPGADQPTTPWLPQPDRAGTGQAVTIKSIAEQLGHTDGGVLVLRRYGHLFKGTRRPGALALDEYVQAGDVVRGAEGERADTRPTLH
jgi:hypothetical protein